MGEYSSSLVIGTTHQFNEIFLFLLFTKNSTMGCCGGDKDRGHPKAVIVSGSDAKDCIGTYRRTYCIHREVSSATTRPVYKLEGKNRYIYWNPSPSGWRIGGYNNLAGHTNGNFWFKSRFFNLAPGKAPHSYSFTF